MGRRYIVLLFEPVQAHLPRFFFWGLIFVCLLNKRPLKAVSAPRAAPSLTASVI